MRSTVLCRSRPGQGLDRLSCVRGRSGRGTLYFHAPELFDRPVAVVGTADTVLLVGGGGGLWLGWRGGGDGGDRRRARGVVDRCPRSDGQTEDSGGKKQRTADRDEQQEAAAEGQHR